jgi:membrane protease YdiL (CAAX protease family)
MMSLFVRPESEFFIYGVFISTPAMIVVSVWLTRYKHMFKLSWISILVGFASAAALYLIFLGGNIAIKDFGPAVGIHASSELSIYGTIGSHPMSLQVLILIFDAIGFESYFRGTLQNFVKSRLKSERGKFIAIFIAAFADSVIHIASLNALWIITTFIADSVWGATYYYSKDLGSSMTSHLVWDILIFIVAPIK